MPPTGSDSGSSVGPETGTPVAGDGPVGDMPAPPPADPNLRRLTVTVSGPGELTADGRPLVCPGMCVIDRPPGTPVTLAAAPAKAEDRAVSLFLGWQGSCTGRAGCVVTLDGDKDVRANFHRFVVWEQAATLLGISVVSGALHVAGRFSGTLSLAGQSFTSAGSFDGVVARFEEDGRIAWAKTVTGPGRETVGVALPGSSAAELRLQAVVEAGSSFGPTPLEPGKVLLTLRSNGDLQRAVRTEHDWEGSRFGNGFAFVRRSANGASEAVVRVDDTGQVLWTKPSLGSSGYREAHVCDVAGNVIAMHSLTADTITVAGQTFQGDGFAGSLLLVKLSPQGEPLWAASISATRLNASPHCDSAGDVYVSFGFTGTLKFGNRTRQTASTDEDVAIAKVKGATPDVLWLTGFGSIVDDILGPVAFDAAGAVLFAPRFTDPVTIAGETFPAATILVRLDPATGNVLSALDVGRRVYELAPHPSAGAYFSSNQTVGRLAFPP